MGGMGNPLPSNFKNIFANRVNFYYYQAINQSHGGMGWVTSPPPNSKIGFLDLLQTNEIYQMRHSTTLSDHKCKSLIVKQDFYVLGGNSSPKFKNQKSAS